MDALVELHDQATRLLREDRGNDRSPERARLLHVVVPAARRGAALQLLRGLEHHPLAPGPVAVLDAPHAVSDPGWAARSEALRRQHHERSAAAPADDAWPLLPLPPSSRGLAGFAEQLAQVQAATPGGRGWVVVLAPTHVKAAPQWSRAIAMLLHGSALGDVRWVVVDVERSSLVEGVAEGRQLRRVELGDDGASPLSELAASLTGPPAAGAPGARARGSTPPPRPGQGPPPVEDAEAQRRRDVAALVIGANEAQRKGDAAGAVERQRKAAALCEDAGWNELTVSMELVLGGYLLAADAAELALQRVRRAVELAARVPSRPELRPLAQLSLGSTLMARGDRPAAMLTYADAVTSAEGSGSIALRLEACRLTADTAVLLGMEAQAIAFWSRAVQLAETQPVAASLGSAGHSARAMALLCKRRGLHEASQRYWDAARRFEGLDMEALREQAASPEPAAPAPLPSAPTPTPLRSNATVPLAPALPLPSAIEDGTADLSLEDLAAIHWQGMIPNVDQAGLPPPTVVHQWTSAEQDAIRRATTSVISDDSTGLLTREEIFALHGQADLPPAREASPAATALLERATAIAMLRASDPEAEGTSWIARDELAAIRARLGRSVLADDPSPPPPVAEPQPVPPPSPPKPLPEVPRGPGDTTSMMTRERLAELARAHAERTKKDRG